MSSNNVYSILFALYMRLHHLMDILKRRNSGRWEGLRELAPIYHILLTLQASDSEIDTWLVLHIKLIEEAR